MSSSELSAPLRGDTAEEVVENLLSILEHADAPEVFARRDEVHVARATAFIRKALVVDPEDFGFDDGTPVYVPEHARRGRPMKPWKAAAEFARCFGPAIPDRERDAKRRK